MCTLVVSEIPITGYELEYDPDLWNETEVASGKYIRHYTNCYAYAINNQIDPIQNSFGCNSDSYQVKQQPGEFYSDNNTNGDALGLQNWLGNFVGEKIINAVHKDFEIHNTLLDTNLQFLDASGNVPLGGYKVYLAIKPMGLFVSSDYHWYRQNPDGTWSHKQGTQPVTNEDKNGNIIWNPKAAAELAGYTEEVGYFIVTPWNNLYEPISAAQLESNTDIASACTATTNAIVWTNSVEVGMSIDDVIELLGYAGEDIGSGTVIHKYATTQGRNVIISYIMDADGVFRVVGIYHQ